MLYALDLLVPFGSLARQEHDISRPCFGDDRLDRVATVGMYLVIVPLQAGLDIFDDLPADLPMRGLSAVTTT